MNLLLQSIATNVTLAPIRRLDLLLTTQGEIMRQQSTNMPIFNGPIDCLKKIIAKQGLSSLWRGSGPIIAVSVVWFVVPFALHKAWSKWQEKAANEPHGLLQGLKIFAGLFAVAFVSAVFAYPLELSYCKIAADIGDIPRYSGMRQVFSEIIENSGFRGLFSGFEFSFFKVPFMVLLYPLMLMQQRVAIAAGTKYKYNGPIEMFKQIKNTEGWRGFYRGFQWAMIKYIFSSIFNWESLKKILYLLAALSARIF